VCCGMCACRSPVAGGFVLVMVGLGWPSPSDAKASRIFADNEANFTTLSSFVNLGGSSVLRVRRRGVGVGGPQPQCLVGTAGGDPRTVGAERHAVHIGLRGVRLRRGSGKGAASGMTSSLTWTCPTAGSPRTGTATAPSTGRWCGDESPHQRGAPQAQERRHKRKKGGK